MISSGLSEEEIKALWTYGNVERCVNLREVNYVRVDGVLHDYGQDYIGLANYLFDHWTPEQGGHHWYITRNHKKPVSEAPKELIETDEEGALSSYSDDEVPEAPEGYELTEIRRTDYGYRCFRYVYRGKKGRRGPKRKKRAPAVMIE